MKITVFPLRHCIAALLALPAVVQAQFTYTTNGGSITITRYTGSSGLVVIPSTTNGYTVTAIGAEAFFQSRLTNIVIPNTVTNIGDDAFTDSANLTSIAIPSGVASIGESTFDACASLASVTIPGSVTNIGNSAFQDCAALTNIVIPPGVISIGENAFYSCRALSGVTIADTVTGIGTNAFAYCTKLTSVTIPGSVTSIGLGAFEYCTGLTNISVDASSASFTSLNGVLFDKAQDTLIQYPTGLAGSIYSIPMGVTDIAYGAFQDCTQLDSVTIPDGVISIGDFAFQYGGLANVILPDSVTSIGSQAFEYSAHLTNVVVSSSVTNIGVDAFFSCTSLSAAYFPGNAPPDFGDAFTYDPVTVYYLPGTTGWGPTFGGASTRLWFRPQPVVLNFEPSFGVRNGQFGFPISWATNTSVTIQGCTNLFNPVWIALATNALVSGTNYFTDPQWTNYPSRFYRITGP